MKFPVISKQEPLGTDTRFSRLFRVEFESTPHPALLKIPANPWDRDTIANEATLLEGVTHPCVRHRLAYDAEQQQLLLEYLEAPTLQELAEQGMASKSPLLAHELLHRLAVTIADLREGVLCPKAIVHYDIKASNVLVTSTTPPALKLIDFSHSYFRGSTPVFARDLRDNRVGTPHYMAPEKWENDFEAGTQSDVYAFGVLAYYVCTARYPFEGSPADIEARCKSQEPESPLDLNPALVRTTALGIMNCLEKKPHRRPSMARVAQTFAASISLLAATST